MKKEREFMKVLSVNNNCNLNINRVEKKKEMNNVRNSSHTLTSNPLAFNPAYFVSFSGACVDLSKAMKTLKATEI